MEYQNWYELVYKLSFFALLILFFPLPVMVLKVLIERFDEKELDNLMPMTGTFLLLLSIAFGSIIWLIEKNYPEHDSRVLRYEMCKNVVPAAQAEECKASREAYAEIVEPIYDETDRQFSQQLLKLVANLPYRTEVDESEYSTLSFSDRSEEFTSSIRFICSPISDIDGSGISIPHNLDNKTKLKGFLSYEYEKTIDGIKIEEGLYFNPGGPKYWAFDDWLIDYENLNRFERALLEAPQYENLYRLENLPYHEYHRLDFTVKMCESPWLCGVELFVKLECRGYEEVLVVDAIKFNPTLRTKWRSFD